MATVWTTAVAPLRLLRNPRRRGRRSRRSSPEAESVRRRSSSSAPASRDSPPPSPSPGRAPISRSMAVLILCFPHSASASVSYSLGVRSLVLEQGDSLRAGGTSLTLFKNAWRVLDALGVGQDLRREFLEIEGSLQAGNEVDGGKLLRYFTFKDVDPSQEVRAVERRVLLETLASRLPADSISFSSRLKSISKGETMGTLLELEDGTLIHAKVVIGCDGVRSPVAKWLGFSEPRYVGHCAFRGLGVYPEGHSLDPKVNYVYGRGVRAGYVPVSPTRCTGPRVIDPSALKREAAEMVVGWPAELRNAIDRTPDGSIVRTPLVDRWLWRSSLHLPPPAAWWSPGACCAVEDAVVLAGKLATAMAGGSRGNAAIDRALEDFCSERLARVFPLTVRSNLVGSLLQNGIVIPKLVMLGPFLEHTNFDCELPGPLSVSSVSG
ncbi:unnamed protein product [Spirodela intermedia]|uniref:FAD-binding domain-containing protein n=1 Tax=Spirodela intermedia TaxID=51605 RepID=A0A7I8JI25_SPIIN|nr:unnamed protein product [Spirodela intermedia]CAA6669798.1 unnamed protein product [Spirodela intermedia]